MIGAIALGLIMVVIFVPMLAILRRWDDQDWVKSHRRHHRRCRNSERPTFTGRPRC